VWKLFQREGTTVISHILTDICYVIQNTSNYSAYRNELANITKKLSHYATCVNVTIDCALQKRVSMAQSRFETNQFPSFPLLHKVPLIHSSNNILVTYKYY